MSETAAERLASGEKAAGLIEQTSIGLCLVDGDLRYAWVNDAFAELLRYDKADLIGRPLLEITHPDDIDLDRDMSERVFAGEIPYFTARKRYLGGDGSIIVSDLLATACFDENGDVTYGLGVQTNAEHVDPTAQRIETLQRSAAIGQLTASAVHDIRNSLSSMSIAVETLDPTAGPSPGVALLRREIDSALGLLSSIATFASPPTPTTDQTPLFSVGALVDQTRALLNLVVPAGTRLDIDLEAASSFPNIEPREFQQVIMNLVLNARDATVGTDGVITITAARTPGDPMCTDICVKDNGHGMAPDELNRAFDPYFTTKGDDGTGLGLSICRDIAERHGGKMIARSTLGEGSHFTIRLPIVQLRSAP